MNANDIARKYALSPKIQGLLASKDFLGTIKAIRSDAGCTLREARDVAEILRGNDLSGAPIKMFTQNEVDDMIVRNAIHRLTLTAVEHDAFERKGLLK